MFRTEEVSPLHSSRFQVRKHIVEAVLFIWGFFGFLLFERVGLVFFLRGVGRGCLVLVFVGGFLGFVCFNATIQNYAIDFAIAGDQFVVPNIWEHSQSYQWLPC